MIDPLWNPFFTVTEPQIMKDRVSSWSSDHSWRSARIWFYIDCRYHNLRLLTRNEVCEQVEYLSRHKNTWICINWILRRHDEDSNQPIQKYRCSYKFKPSNGVSIRKNVSLGSFYNTEAGKCTTLTNFHILEVIFIFSLHSERALHIKKNQTNRWVHTYV